MGTRISAHARQALAAVDAIQAEADSTRGMLSGRLRVGSIPSAAVSFVPKVVAHFSRRHPGVGIVLLEVATRGRTSVRELANEPFIMSRYVSERLIRAAYAQHEISLSVRFEVQDLSTLVSLVREGLGISIVPRVAFPETPPGVALLPLSPQIRRELGYALGSPQRASPASSEFVRSLGELSAGNRRP